MMQLLCNGVVLDLYDDASVQFTHENPLFSFDKLSCERTTQFKLPSTPTNDRVFSLARIPAYKGEGMRRRFSAQLCMGVVIKEGYLYIASYDGTDYNAVFVTGVLVGLQAVKNAGKLPQVAPDYIASYLSLEQDADRGSFPDYMSQFKYRQAQTSPCAPSASVYYIIQRICSDFGISITIPSIASRLALVPPYPRTLQESKIHFVNRGFNVLPVLEDDPQDYSNNLTTDLSLLEQTDVAWYTYVKNTNTGITEQTWEYLTQCLTAKQDLSLTFPNDFPTDLFLIKIVNPSLDGMAGVQFLGDYSFVKYEANDESIDTDTGASVTTDTEAVITGTPLRGRTIEVQDGDVLLFVTPYDYVYARSTQEWSWRKNGWAFHQGDWTAEIKMQGTQDRAQIGEAVRLRDNVPDIEFTDLLKAVAAVDGKVLNFENGTIKFEDLNTSGYQVVEVSKTIERKDVERKFCDYGQNNLVQYAQDKITPPQYVFKEGYTIDNDNLEAEKVLLEIPLSPASEISESGKVRAYVNNEFEDGDLFFLMQINGLGGDTYMHRVPLVKCAGLQALCDASTQHKISVRISAYEYDRITAKTILLVDGIKYLWTTRSWQNDEAQFTLAKLP